MREKNKRGRGIFFLILIIASLLILGVEGCPTGGTRAGKTGLDFSLVQGVDKLYNGKSIQQGDTFRIQVHIENYDKRARSGEVCVSDEIDKSNGGIESQCAPFSIKAAEVSGEKKTYFGTQTTVEPATADVMFPAEGGEYSYRNLLITQNTKAYIYLKYNQNSRIEAPNGVSIPTPEQENVQLNQDPAPVTISVQKSVSKKEDAYEVTLGVQFSKDSQSTLYSPSKDEENYIYFKASMPPKGIVCKPSENDDKEKFAQGLIELKNTKFIKCSALVDITEHQQYQLLIDLNYGVKIEKEVQFTINVAKK